MEYRCPVCGVFIAPTSTVEAHERTQTHLAAVADLDRIRQRDMGTNDRPAEPKADIETAKGD